MSSPSFPLSDPTLGGLVSPSTTIAAPTATPAPTSSSGFFGGLSSLLGNADTLAVETLRAVNAPSGAQIVPVSHNGTTVPTVVNPLVTNATAILPDLLIGGAVLIGILLVTRKRR